MSYCESTIVVASRIDRELLFKGGRKHMFDCTLYYSNMRITFYKHTYIYTKVTRSFKAYKSLCVNILFCLNSFSAELFKVDSSMFKLGRLYFHVIGFLEYFYNLQPNNADFRWDSSLRADSPESVLFAKSSILPLALKELTFSISSVTLCTFRWYKYTCSNYHVLSFILYRKGRK